MKHNKTTRLLIILILFSVFRQFLKTKYRNYRPLSIRLASTKLIHQLPELLNLTHRIIPGSCRTGLSFGSCLTCIL